MNLSDKVANAMMWYAFSAIKKPPYHIRNWSACNSSLKQRGSRTIWISPEAVVNCTMDELTGQLSASPTYTNLAIEPPRVSRRLQFLRGWSHENNNKVFTGVP
jgi:hypothetical protein